MVIGTREDHEYEHTKHGEILWQIIVFSDRFYKLFIPRDLWDVVQKTSRRMQTKTKKLNQEVWILKKRCTTQPLNRLFLAHLG
jgi:hypothetical protein